MTVPPEPAENPPPARRSTPAPLTVAASLAVVEGIVLVLLGVSELWSLSGDRLLMGATTSLFFLGYGVGLGFCAWAVNRLVAWARAPIILTQLIGLGLAWNFRQGTTTLVAVALLVVALVVLAGIFHPASMAALNDED